MTYRQIHLHLRPYPTATPLDTIEYACAFAHHFETRLIVSSPRISVNAPPNWFAGKMLAGMAEEFESAAAKAASDLDVHISERAAALGLQVHIDDYVEHWPSPAEDASWRGRTSDLCVLGHSRGDANQSLATETWLFGVGRPCLIYPENTETRFSLGCVLLSWDFSKLAARAIGDALPLLRRANQVRIVTVRGEKDLPSSLNKDPLIEYLAAHGVAAVSDDVQLGNRRIGETLLTHAGDIDANLIVMGAFGHSRLKEFLLGGATRDVLAETRLPLLMAH